IRASGADHIRRAAAGRAHRWRRGRRDRRLPRPPPVRLRQAGRPMNNHADVFVIGAGPAGLTAAYCLTKQNPSVIVIEKDPVYVGGISRTVEYNGFMFDIGGHRFFSKSKKWWTCGGRFFRTISSNGRACRTLTTAASITPN